MTEYWGALEKSLTDAELIEAAIERICVTHNYFNTVAVWGLMPKSQTDDQTILAAVSAAVAAHEADADAHLGVGEALQSHAASEIIDHLAGSIVSDKLTNIDWTFQTAFESLAGWTATGDISNIPWPGFRITCTYGGTASGRLFSEAANRGLGLFTDDDFLFQTVLKIYLSSNFTGYFGFFYYSGYVGEYGVGFKVVNSALYGLYDVNGEGIVINLGTNIDSYCHCYRVQYDHVVKTITWYFDGIVKGTLDMTSITMDNDVAILFSGTKIGAGYTYLDVANMLCSFGGWR